MKYLKIFTKIGHLQIGLELRTSSCISAIVITKLPPPELVRVKFWSGSPSL